jgi:predicted DCC family thiol-disulfide oxidoreductase YuxK
MSTKLKVVYDDGCPMCTVGMNVADALDKDEAVEFIGMNTEEGKSLIRERGLDMNATAYAFHADGTTSEKRHMLRDVLAHNGPIGFVLSLPFRVPYLGDALYALFAFVRLRITRSPL